jgi:O-antigen/teichoic acid export membrane protein
MQTQNGLVNTIKSLFQRHGSMIKIIENTGWLMAERVVRIILGMIVGILVARYLKPARFGILQYAMSVTGFVGVFVYLGLNGIVGRDLVKNPDNRMEIMGTTWFLKTIGSLLGMGAIFILVVFFQRGDRTELYVVLVVAASLLLRPLDVIYTWYESRVQLRVVVLFKIFSMILSNTLRVIAILTEAELLVFAAIFTMDIIVASIAIFIFYNIKTDLVFRWRIRFRLAINLLKQSWLLILSGFLSIINLKIDQLMLKWMSGNVEVGIYATAVTLSESWYFIPTAIVASIYPTLIKQRKKDSLLYDKSLQKGFDILCMIAMSIAFPVSFLSHYVVNFLYGQEFSGAAIILTIHIWAGLFVFMRQLFSKWLIIEGFLVYSFISHSLGALVNVGINFVLIPKIGGLGAAVATMISYASSSYLALFLQKDTRRIAVKMTKSLVFPVRLILFQKRVWK